ncbi:MAG TPA: GNAT family N-acetyltransferase [Ktedonobacteraceae bacterium]|nr:GNAT family N-acetyltransferase [Ktedonobacteraceae bacterium]
MNAIVPGLAAPELTGALEANLAEEVEVFGRALPGSEIYHGEELVRFSTRRSFFNGVHHARFASDEKAYVDAKIAETLAYFKARELSCMWVIGPSVRPTDLATRLLEHGLTFLNEAPVLVLDLSETEEDAPTLEGLAIQEASNAEELRPLVELEMQCFAVSEEIAHYYYDTYVATGFGSGQAWHHYIGMLHGRPVAMAALLLHAGVAGIYGVGTIPEARRRGIGMALVQHALREARSAGYRVALLTPTDMSLRIYQRLGFQQHCALQFYLWRPEQQEPSA